MLRPSLWHATRRSHIHVCTSCLASRLPVSSRRRLSSAGSLASQTDSGSKSDATLAVSNTENDSAPPKSSRSKAERVPVKKKKEHRPANDGGEKPQKTKGKKGGNCSVRGYSSSKGKLPPPPANASKSKAASKRTAEAAKKPLNKKPPKQAEAESTTAKATPDGKAKPSNGIDTSTPLARSTETLHTESLNPSKLRIDPVSTESDKAVPKLSYGLDRVLFNPGVYHLQDPRSRLYNFDPYLRSIMPVSEFDFSALNEYITSSRDQKLREFAKKEGKKYIGSSSSMTGVLSHFHFLLSGWRPVNTSMLSKGFDAHLNSFTRISRAPNAVFLRYKDGVYAIDADKQFDSTTLVMNLGISMEKLLTLPTDQYERYRKTSENKINRDEVRPETYHYSTLGDFLMRSQLDAHDPRLPGTGMFDLKTRAVLSIRMNSSKPEEGQGYQLRSRFGPSQSFEREYYDMIRSAFLKYSLQVRIGRMDGIFVAYHNTQRIFGFQYISRAEMDLALHGQEDVIGDAEFKLSLSLWNKVLNQATKEFPGKSLRFHFETRETPEVPFMYIFAEPVEDEEIDAIQTRNNKKVEEVQNKLLHPELFKEEEGSAETKDGSSKPKRKLKTPQKLEPLEDISPDKPLLSMALSVENVVNGNRVLRPERLYPKHKWAVHYRLSAIEPDRGREIYRACRRRRQVHFEQPEDGHDFFLPKFMRDLKAQSEQGAKWREQEDMIEKEQGIITFD